MSISISEMQKHQSTILGMQKVLYQFYRLIIIDYIKSRVMLRITFLFLTYFTHNSAYNYKFKLLANEKKII